MSEWVPYAGQKETFNRKLQQESHTNSVLVALCDLFEVVHGSLYVLYAPGKVTGSQDIIGIYTRYLDWRNSIPSTLRHGQNSTPQVFFIQYTPCSTFDISLTG